MLVIDSLKRETAFWWFVDILKSQKPTFFLSFSYLLKKCLHLSYWLCQIFQNRLNLFVLAAHVKSNLLDILIFRPVYFYQVLYWKVVQ